MIKNETFIKDKSSITYKMELDAIVEGLNKLNEIGGAKAAIGFYAGSVIGAIAFYRSHRKNLTKNFYGNEFVENLEKKPEERQAIEPEKRGLIQLGLGHWGYNILYSLKATACGIVGSGIGYFIADKLN